ncbi:MAG: Gfo/Idh/MocA family oxidoreductase [Clostridia bacterium]|nr:Gfo/Idh/MocA family oxidoreductase [Clostridia bacterium]
MRNGAVGIAVIGYGGMGGYHAEHLLKMDKFDLKGVYDIRECQLQNARDKGIRAYTSLEELLADPEIELVTIATPNDVHKPIAIQAMRAGKNVISEKPVTLSSEDLEEMIAVSEQEKKLFTVHQNRRWDDDYLTVKNVIDTNLLGPVFRIESRVQGSRGIPSGWRREKEHGGGMVLDWGVHLLDQALTLCDDDRLISVYASITNITNKECDDGFYSELKFASGLMFSVEVTTNNFFELPRWYVLGVNGTAVLEDWGRKPHAVLVHNWNKNDAAPVQLGTGISMTMAPRTDDTIKDIPLEKANGDWSQYYDNIYDVLRRGAEQIVTHRQMRRSTRLMEMIFESAAKNEVIHCDI